MAFVEVPEKRKTSGLVFKDGDKERFVSVLGTHLCHKGNILDMTPIRRNDAVIDGWEVTTAGWHYRLGQPNGNSDGWVGFGGLEGKRWFYSRLVRVGYLHYPTRNWQDVGGAPSYVRGDLSSSTQTIDVGGVPIKAVADAEWRNIWNTPGAGEVYLRWRVEGKKLKEDVILNSAARSWIVANRPPVTPVASTYFGFVFQLDVTDIPRLLKNGTLQDLNGDFDDDNGISELTFEDGINELLGFLPISKAYSQDLFTSISLRKRIWKDNDGNVYMLVGAKVSEMNGLPAGDVVFDPTFQVQPDATSGVDASLIKSSPTTNFGTSQGMDLNDGVSEERNLIKFDLTSIPPGSSVVSATLEFTTRGVSSGSVSCFVSRIKSANSGWTEAGATWNTTNGSTSWAGSSGCSTSGTDYESTSLGAWTSTAAGSGGTVDSVDLLAALVGDWVSNPSGNYGAVVYATGTFGSILYASSDHATAVWRPRLTVNYSLPVASTDNGGVRRRMRSEDELRYHPQTPLREVTLNVRLASQNFQKDSHAVTAAEFKKKVDNR